MGAMPVYLALTKDDTPEWKREQIKRACLYLAGILIVFFLLGTSILSFFGITIEGLRIAGGLIIMKSGLELLNTPSDNPKGKSLSRKLREAASEQTDISFSPLAMPMLSGPGSISLLVSFSLGYNEAGDYAAIIGAILAVALLSYMILRIAPSLVKFLGESGIAALSRMMGFIVLAIGIQFIVNGVVPIAKSLL